MNHGGNVWQGGSPADWLDYSANIRPEGAPDWVRTALLSAMDNITYYPQLTMERSRGAVGAYLGLPGENVLPTAGGVSAIGLAVRLGAARMRIPAPAFLEYAQLSESAGVPVERVPLLGDNHAILSPAESLGKELEKNTCVWLCNPWNPVGAAFSREEIISLLERVEAADGWLAVDEAFIEYCPEHSVADLIGKRQRLLITGSMTKTLGIPGVRLGYICGGETLARLQRLQTPWELNCFAEAVALALPGHREEIAAECAAVRGRRERFRAGLEALGIYVYPSEANFVLCDFGREVRPIEDRLHAKKILVRRCMNFSGIDDGHHLRLAVKDDKTNQFFLNTLQEAMQCAENH